MAAYVTMPHMNHVDHVNLLRDVGIASGQTWADLGAGTGAFTLAIAELLGSAGTIYAVDRDSAALRQHTEMSRTRYPAITMRYLTADFTQPLALPALDGLLMANSLHFVTDQERVVRQLKRYLGDSSRLALVEYNTDQGNQWVPHPLSYSTWAALAARCGFANTRQVSARPSRFLDEIYSAVSW